MNIAKSFELTCKKATFLSSKKEEGKLTLRESMLLILHLKTCEPCRRFISQSKIMSRSFRLYKENSLGTAQNLSEEKKLRMQEQIEILMNRQK